MAPRDISSVQGMANNAIDLYEKFKAHMPAQDAERQAVSISAQVANSIAGVRVEDAKKISQASISEYRSLYNRVASAVTNFFTDSRKSLSQSAQERAVQRVSVQPRGEVQRGVPSGGQGRAQVQGKGFDSDKFSRQVIDNYLENRKQMSRGEAVGRTVTSQAYAAERNGGISREEAAKMAEKVIVRYREATQSMTGERAREAVAKSMSEQDRSPKRVEGREKSQHRHQEISASKTKVQQVSHEMHRESRGLER